MNRRNAILLWVTAAAMLTAADSPFVGKWKLNVAKSQFTGTTATFEQLPSGEMQATMEGQSYKFKADGKEYPAIFGSTAKWRQVDPNTWEVVYTTKGTTLSTDTLKVQPGGKTMTVTSKGKRPNGESFEDSLEYQRISGSSGLAGKWKSTKVNIGSPEMQIQPYDGDGLTWTIDAYKATVNVKFDGKDYVAKGPTVPDNFTLAMTKTGPRSFNLVEKDNGKVVYRGAYQLSSDGKTLTVVATPEGTSEKTTAVYDRQ